MPIISNRKFKQIVRYFFRTSENRIVLGEKYLECVKSLGSYYDRTTQLEKFLHKQSGFLFHYTCAKMYMEYIDAKCGKDCSVLDGWFFSYDDRIRFGKILLHHEQYSN